MEKVYSTEQLCSGCRICSNICPTKAIVMQADKKGYSYPVIEQDKCIDCKQCIRVCPYKDGTKFEKSLNIYACKNKDLKKIEVSSSGGFFGEVATKVINNGGVVFGAIFDDEFKVIHKKAETLEELEKIKRSKYVQSDTKLMYIEIKNELKQNKLVLASGTPCQMQALKNMNLPNKENLIVIDFVCHGVMAPEIFEEYKKFLEKKYNSKIINFNFRHKNEKGTQNVKVDFANGQTYICSYREGDPYYNLFLKDYTLRESCYNCKFKNIERISDITLADFWGIQNLENKEFANKKSVSLILINSKKGQEIIEEIKDKFDILEIEEKDCKPYNCFDKIIRPEKVDFVWEQYIEKGFEQLFIDNPDLLTF